MLFVTSSAVYLSGDVGHTRIYDFRSGTRSLTRSGARFYVGSWDPRGEPVNECLIYDSVLERPIATTELNGDFDECIGSYPGAYVGLVRVGSGSPPQSSLIELFELLSPN